MFFSLSNLQRFGHFQCVWSVHSQFCHVVGQGDVHFKGIIDASGDILLVHCPFWIYLYFSEGSVLPTALHEQIMRRLNATQSRKQKKLWRPKYRTVVLESCIVGSPVWNQGHCWNIHMHKYSQFNKSRCGLKPGIHLFMGVLFSLTLSWWSRGRINIVPRFKIFLFIIIYF